RLRRRRKGSARGSAQIAHVLAHLYRHYFSQSNISPPTEGARRSIPRDQATKMVRRGKRDWGAPRVARWRGAALVMVTLLRATAAHAQTCIPSVSCPASGYCNRFTCIKNGAITFTGNTLGLSKATNLNEAGKSDAIGAFTTINTARQVPTFPPGTTLAFGQNSASATLNLPAGSTVLYAELTWGGTYGLGGQDVSGSRNNSITLVDPAGTTSTIIPDPAFQRQL